MHWLLLSVGFVFRLLLIGVPGFKADVAYWKGWGLAVADKGILWLANNTNYNYPPGFAYVLWLVNKIYAFFLNPYNINQYWLDTNYLYLFIFKLITILADIGIVYLIIKIADKLKFKWGKLLAVFYFLNFVVLYDGVIWGQVDQFGLFLFLASVYLLLLDRPYRASVVFAIACLMKMQNIIFIPLFYLFIYKKYNWIGLVKAVQFSFLTFAIIVAPFWLNRQMGSLIRLLTVNSDWFPYYSLNAFNFWWIASGLDGMKISDKTLFLGIINAKQLGLYFFSFAYFIASVRLYLSKKEQLFETFITVSILVVFAFFHLLTESHERYLFPLIGLLPVLFMVRKEKKPDAWLFFYLTVSVAVFLNMYVSTAFNYPDQVFWPISFDLTKQITLYLSFFHIGLFIYFIIKYFSHWISQNKLIVISSFCLLVGVLFLKNFNYLVGKAISLNELSPIYAQQDYLKPMINKTVNSAIGVFSWNRLSNNYYFYEKGIGSHANSEINYSIQGRFSKFITEYGIDTEGSADAKAYFLVIGDGRELYRSKIKGRYDLPEKIELNVKNIRSLTLKIVKGGKSINGVHADWFDPILKK